MHSVVNVHEAKTQLSKLLQRVSSGEEIVIAKNGEPIAILSPYRPPPIPRKPGSDAGKVILTDTFDDPLPEFEDL